MKYLEALGRNDRPNLMVFESFNEEPFKKIYQIRTIDNFRQHQLCKTPRPNLDIETLCADHTCAPSNGPNGSRATKRINSVLVGFIYINETSPPMGVHSPFHPVISPSPSAMAGWMLSAANPSVPHSSPTCLMLASCTAASLKHPRAPLSVTVMDYQTADSDHLMKCIRSGHSDEVYIPGSTHPSNQYSPDDVPKAVMRILSQGSNVMFMDFNPQQQTVLLVRKNVGGKFVGHDAPVCSVCLHYKENIQFICSTAVNDKIQAWIYDCLASRVDYEASGLWCTAMAYSADGTRFFSCGTSKEGESRGFSEAINVRLLVTGALSPTNDVRGHMISIAECTDKIQPPISTGTHAQSSRGADIRPRISDCVEKMKAWKLPDIVDSAQLKALLLPDPITGCKFICSTAVNEKIHAWIYDCLASRVDYEAPGLWCTTMAYSADGTRFFSCGTSKEGESRGFSEASNVKLLVTGVLGPTNDVPEHMISIAECTDKIQPPVSTGTHAESSKAVDIRPRISDCVDKMKTWKLPDLVDPAQLKALLLPDPTTGYKFICSTAWIYDCLASRVDYEASGLWCTTMAYNADGIRFFSCGTSKEGESRGFSEAINVKLLVTGVLVPINDVPGHMISIAECTDKIQPPISTGTHAESSRAADIRPRISDCFDKMKAWKLPDIVDSAQLKALLLPDPITGCKFICSTAVNEKIHAWIYDCLASRVDYEAPGLWCTTMAYSADGTRFFSCGTSKEGESRGFSEAINVRLLVTGALGPTNDVRGHMISIAECTDKIQPPISTGTHAESSRAADIRPRISDCFDKMKAWKLPDIVDSAQLKALLLPDPITGCKVLQFFPKDMEIESGPKLVVFGKNVRGSLRSGASFWQAFGVLALGTISVFMAKKRSRQMHDAEVAFEDHGQIGLKNLGNSCYANVGLQTLISIPTLRDALNEVVDPGPLTLALRQALYGHVAPVVDLADFFDVVEQRSREVNDQNILAIYRNVEESPIQVLVYLMKLVYEEHEVVGGLFRWRRRSQKTFVCCHHAPPARTRVMCHLLLQDLPGDGELVTDVVTAYFGQESVETKRNENCPNCRRRNPKVRTRWHILQPPPRILVLELDYSSGSRKNVEYEEEMTIGAHTLWPGDEEEGLPAAPLRYRLRSVIVRQKRNKAFHIYAFVYRTNIDGQGSWYKADDAEVTRVEPNRIRDATGVPKPEWLVYELMPLAP